MNRIRSLSRRSAIGRLGLAGAAALGPGLAPAAARGAAPAPKPRGRRAEALALVGDRFHSFDYIRTALTRTLVKEGGITVDFTPDPHVITAENLNRHRLLIILCDGMTFPGGYGGPYSFMDQVKVVSDPPLPPLDETPVMWITPEKGQAIRRFVEAGGSAWFFHNASYISGTNADFRHVEGALFTGHTIPSFWNPEYIKLQQNALKWLLRA